ncbi:MAG: hypothetical protein HYX68_28685 [Planctomycetes bacterium]|jgi:hypothetical protein|nr:hypothetical protein [Planctomycetota bacterium]
MKRRWWIVSGVFTLILLLLLVVAPLFWRDQITVRNFSTIDVGMSETNVVALLGRPADDVRPWQGRFLVEPSDPPFVQKTWHGRRIKIVLVFGTSGTVHPERSRSVELTLIDRIEQWLSNDSVAMVSPDP